MGIKVKITQDELPLKYQTFHLQETKDGATHSVYLLDNKYVLKIVENRTAETILAEQKLLKDLDGLCVPKILDIYEYPNYTMVFYSQMKGKSSYNPSILQIEQIALFLKKFHCISKNSSSSNQKIYEKNSFKDLIIQTNEPLFLEYFNNINCKLKNDGVIHGDLFSDNAKFEDDELTGVFDFIEACEGDFVFELAVVTISWCFENNKLNTSKVKTLLDTYGLNINIKEFNEYIKYALLYYTTTRYLNNRNYKELLERLKSI
ncbi:phosphotransferase [Arcobacteraceae bacterium]|nr:phosphotransferase [Arcobacteraceae bacterium]